MRNRRSLERSGDIIIQDPGRLPSGDAAPTDRETPPKVLYQRWRDASRPKPLRSSEFAARSTMADFTTPRAPFISVARLRRPCLARGVSRTSLKPSSTKSLSLRPRRAAPTWHGGIDRQRFQPWSSSHAYLQKTSSGAYPLTFLLSPLPEPHRRASTVLVDELDAGRFERTPDCQVVCRRQRGLTFLQLRATK